MNLYRHYLTHVCMNCLACTSMLSATCFKLDEVLSDILDDVIDEVSFGYCLEVHRMIKKGILTLTEMDPQSLQEFSK